MRTGLPASLNELSLTETDVAETGVGRLRGTQAKIKSTRTCTLPARVIRGLRPLFPSGRGMEEAERFPDPPCRVFP
jgi:hypothetical protein